MRVQSSTMIFLYLHSLYLFVWLRLSAQTGVRFAYVCSKETHWRASHFSDFVSIIFLWECMRNEIVDRGARGD